MASKRKGIVVAAVVSRTTRDAIYRSAKRKGRSLSSLIAFIINEFLTEELTKEKEQEDNGKSIN